MELVRYLHLLRSRWQILFAVVVIAMVAAWFFTPRHHLYRATSTLYVGSRVINLNSPAELNAGQTAALDRFTKTFADMIHSRPIAAKAIDRTGVNRSADSVVNSTTAEQVTDTQLLSVSVTDRDPATARALANGLADSFVQEVQTFEPSAPATEGTVPSLPAYVFEQARLPVSPEPTGLLTNLAVAALLGLSLGVAGVLLDDYIDITVRGIEDAERRLELPVLGAVPDLGQGVTPRMVTPASGPVASPA